MAAFVLVAAAHPDRERHLAARLRREMVAHRDQIAGDEREQIGGLRVRVDPFRPMAAVVGLAAPDGLPFDSNTGQRVLSAMIVVGVARHHVRPVDKVGDAAEAFGLALGAEIAARHVQPGECRVVLRRDERLDLQREGVRHVRDQ